MNAKQRYDLEHPIISFRVDKNLRKIISDYMERNKIDKMQKFVELLISDFVKKNTERTYKLKD